MAINTAGIVPGGMQAKTRMRAAFHESGEWLTKQEEN
jgi:hypothetical protein